MNPSFDNTASFIHDYENSRITIRRIKVRKLLDLSSSRVENIDYPMTHLRENYYPRSAANLHYELFSPSGAIRNRHFRLSHHTPRRPGIVTTTITTTSTTNTTVATAIATDVVTIGDARNDGIKNNGGKSMSCLYHREFTAARVRYHYQANQNHFSFHESDKTSRTCSIFRDTRLALHDL